MTKGQKKEFVEKIERICSEIGKKGLTDLVVEEAQNRNHARMIERFEAFVDENEELSRTIVNSFGEYERDNGDEEIFFIREDEVKAGDEIYDYYCVYDSSRIDPMNLLVYLVMSDGSVCYQQIFSDETILIEAIREKGFNQVADYMEYTGIYTSNDLLMAFE